MASLYDENRLETELESKIKTFITNELPSANSYRAEVLRKDSQGIWWVRIDGNNSDTPVLVNKVDMSVGDIVTVTIRDHLTIADGNLTSPALTAANTEAYVNQIVTDSVKAVSAEIGYLQADVASIGYAQIEDADIVNARVVNLTYQVSQTVLGLTAATADIADLQANALTANSAIITNLQTQTAKVENLTASDLEAATAYVGDLSAANVTASDISADHAAVATLETDYAQIDFANVMTQSTAYAIVQELLATSGWFEQLATPSGTITGELTAVKIDANDVEIDNLKVSNLYLLNDEDGLYYALNVVLGGTSPVEYAALTPEEQAALQSGLHGENIIAGTITADKIYVTDLAAFNATIAGMVFGTVMIGGTNYYTMHTFGKNAVTSATPGMYTDSMGQFSVGSATDYLTFYKDQNGNWKLAIAANQISMGGSTLSSQLDALQAQVDNVVETWFGSGAPSSSTAPESNWTTVGQKNAHLGDVYYDNDTGRAYRYTLSNNVYSWISIPDSAVVAALDAIDGVTDDVTALSEAVDSTIIFKVTEEYSHDESSVTLTAHVYRGGEDIASSFEDTDFAWYRKNEDGAPEVPLGNGRTITVSRSTVGYGAAIKCNFTPTSGSVLLDSDDDTLTDSEGTPIAARTPSGDYVRVADLEATTTVFDTDKLMLVGAEEEQLVTIATLKDVFGDGDYERLDNMPSIEDVTLVGNKTFPDLGIFKTDSQGYPVADDYTLTTLDINSLWANAQPIGA